MRRCRVRGFTIIEVLVALCLLALGTLGATAMQLAALRTRHQSALLTDAQHMAAGMADRMRANTGQMRLADTDNPYLNLFYDVADGAPAAPARQCFTGSACSGAQLASFDIYELKRQIGKVLPGGRVVICRDASPWDEVRHALRWDCGGAGGAPVVIKIGWRGKNPDGSPLQDAARPFAPAVALTLAAGR